MLRLIYIRLKGNVAELETGSAIAGGNHLRSKNFEGKQCGRYNLVFISEI